MRAMRVKDWRALPWVVGEESDGDIPTVDGDYVTLDGIYKVTRGTISRLDDVECMSVLNAQRKGSS